MVNSFLVEKIFKGHFAKEKNTDLRKNQRDIRSKVGVSLMLKNNYEQIILLSLTACSIEHIHSLK
jgi:hypothetical protein